MSTDKHHPGPSYYPKAGPDGWYRPLPGTNLPPVHVSTLTQGPPPGWRAAPPPQSTYPPPYGSPLRQPRNGFGITALVLAIVGLVFGFVPLTGFIAFICGALAILFGLLGLGRVRRREATNKVMAWFGTGVGAAAVVLGIVGMVIVADVTDDLDDGLDDVSGTSLVTYQAESTTGRVGVTYDDANGSMVSQNDQPAPWSRDLEVSNFAPFFSVSISPGISNPNGQGTVTCRVLKGGEVIAEQSASGSYASVTCSANP